MKNFCFYLLRVSCPDVCLVLICQVTDVKPDWERCCGGGGGADIEHFLIVVTGRRHSINSCDTAVGERLRSGYKQNTNCSALQWTASGGYFIVNETATIQNIRIHKLCEQTKKGNLKLVQYIRYSSPVRELAGEQ